MKRGTWIVIGAAIPALLIGALAYWLNRPHTIVYRAGSPGCESELRYDTREGRTGPVRFRDEWQSEPIELVHGDVANIVVSPGRGCERVACELVEDGVRVARAAGRTGAICSAATAR